VPVSDRSNRSVMTGLVPAIHALPEAKSKTWMPGTGPGMTETTLMMS